MIASTAGPALTSIISLRGRLTALTKSSIEWVPTKFLPAARPGDQLVDLFWWCGYRPPPCTHGFRHSGPEFSPMTAKPISPKSQSPLIVLCLGGTGVSCLSGWQDSDRSIKISRIEHGF